MDKGFNQKMRKTLMSIMKREQIVYETDISNKRIMVCVCVFLRDTKSQ